MDISTPNSKTTHSIGKIRKRDDFSHIPIILMNSQTRYGDYEYWTTSGVEEHLSKPIESYKLFSEIRVQLELKNPSLA